MNIGDKILWFRNIEDISTAFILEVTDIYEVGINETYYEITERQLIYGKK